jgi:hypothetical protein
MLLLTCQYFTSAHHNNPNLNPSTAAAVQGSSLYGNSTAGGPFGYGANGQQQQQGIFPQNQPSMQPNG